MSQLAAFDSRPWLILCEGESDRRFFNQLIETRAIPNEFQVRFPSRSPTDRTGGRSRFGPWLMAATLNTGWPSIRAVLIVSDNDDSPNASFEEVRASLAAGDWRAIPTAEGQVAKAKNFPDTVIQMVPSNQIGGLEDLCLLAAYSKWQNIEAPLGVYAQAAGVGSWGATKQSKMKLQSLIAATCQARPDAGFMGHWREDSQYHVPMDHDAFDDLADVLLRFPLLIATS